ncbi:hypothetical protein JQ617_08100 [Bradyrhizobium sp. KB893862 SZCCT0404]|uniref:hypothetical protein n=1 Tax=Bradyrhizobium sp. KB893862 SZCCT0404 TaxID=2807672 RepID=UPI001BA4D535|nr:hypothetical protein [Bradyrhizobium sp. KB893862 SZCCT0404]MBR1173912.1 hypothetical protein [Bradyrhizobium sp. KB893862 SZCCT0404]
MTAEQQLRLECLKVATATVGNPNVLDNARKYFAFVTEVQETEAQEGTVGPVRVAMKGTNQQQITKGKTK